MQLTFKPYRGPVRGVSLIEVLVAIVVLSIGMLGIAGLQVATTKFLQGSRSRGMSAPLLSDIASRVRSNADQAGTNATSGFASTSAYTLTDTWATQQTTPPTTPTTNCEASGIACPPAERATYDVMVWRQRVRAAFPSGSALLSGDRQTGFDVTFMWFDKEYTDKGKSADTQLIKAPVCSTLTEVAGSNRLGQQNCCPAAANAPVGVRCTRFSFTP